MASVWLSYPTFPDLTALQFTESDTAPFKNFMILLHLENNHEKVFKETSLKYLSVTAY